MTYNTDFFQRPIVANNMPIAAGTYKRGQLLAPPSTQAAAGVFTAYVAATTGNANPVGGVVVNDAVIPTGGGFAAIARGEFEKEGIIAANAALSTPVTVDAAVISECFKAGIYLN